MKQRIVVISAILFLILTGCDLSTPEEANLAEIRNALDDIEIAFNYQRLDDIIVHYALDYRHNGNDYQDVLLDWDIRLNDYQELKISEITIELDDDRATVSLIREFKNNGMVAVILIDPADSGDISYWELKNNAWKICGNRLTGWEF
jgi:hypothetical protein